MFRPAYVILLAALCVLVGVALPARAHDPSLSGIRVLYRHDDVVVNVTTHISRLEKAEGRDKGAMSSAEQDQAVRRRLHLRFDGKEFTPQRADLIVDSANDLLSWQTVLTEPVKECEALARLYPEDPASTTLVTLMRDGQAVQETLLNATHPDLLHSQPPIKPYVVALRFLREGIIHIFGGPDHVLFVLGLLLLGGTLKAVLRTVTAFTLAHSVTLSLAATGIWSPSPRIVEPLIALSIVVIAVENLRHIPRKQRGKEAGSAPANGEEESLPRETARDLRPYYAFGFGLIHGFGFAGALAEVGLPKAALGAALASFNIGVEIGQATLVLMALPGLAWLLKTRPVVLRRLVLVGSLVIGVAGAYWFFSRLGTL